MPRSSFAKAVFLSIFLDGAIRLFVQICYINAEFGYIAILAGLFLSPATDSNNCIRTNKVPTLKSFAEN